jgi:hypothetical protein
MKSYPNELETYSYHYTHPRAHHQHQHHYDEENFDDYSREVCNEEHASVKETHCDECTVIGTEVASASGCSLFHLLPIILVSGVVALAIVLLISASVLYVQCKC